MPFDGTRPWPVMVAEPARDSRSEELWRSLFMFNVYRLLLGCVLMLLVWVAGKSLILGQRDMILYLNVNAAYIFLSIASMLLVRVRRPTFNKQLGIQVGTDIICIVLLSHASGGFASNLNDLLLVSIALAGLICRGRITLFFAALASIAVLLEHSYSVLTEEDAQVAQFMQSGLLSIAYFAVAWLAHSLSRYAVASEKLAKLRGEDVSYLAEANRLVIQEMPDGVMLVDERGMIRQANPGAGRLLGVRFAEERKEMLSQCCPLLDALYGVWRQSRINRDEVLSLPGTHSEVKVRFLPVQREGFAGAVVVLEDMRRAQTQAQQVKLAALGRLTANIAHEVRNPLSSISYAAELMKEGEKLEGQDRLVNIILDNTFRLNNIVLDVLQLNRRDRVQKEDFSLSEYVPYFLENLQHSEAFSREIVKVEVPCDCRVSFDKGHFDQVLWNLCRNALRYSQRQPGSVRISAAIYGQGRVTLEIANDGATISEELAQRLFEPFFTTSSGGTGLGLYIARELCDANDAILEYQPGTDGLTCFRIIFGGKDAS